MKRIAIFLVLVTMVFASIVSTAINDDGTINVKVSDYKLHINKHLIPTTMVIKDNINYVKLIDILNAFGLGYAWDGKGKGTITITLPEKRMMDLSKIVQDNYTPGQTLHAYKSSSKFIVDGFKVNMIDKLVINGQTYLRLREAIQFRDRVEIIYRGKNIKVNETP